MEEISTLYYILIYHKQTLATYGMKIEVWITILDIVEGLADF